VNIFINKMPPPLEADLRQMCETISFATLGHYLEEGFMDPAIRLLSLPRAKVVGCAVTVRISPPDSVLVHKATEMLRPGDVLVVDTGGDTRHAPVGEMVALAAQVRGTAAVVIDGVMTDVEEISAMGLPVFARGTSLLTTKLLGLKFGGINVPVSCGGIRVEPGDLILADTNGVMAIRRELIRAIAPTAKASEEREVDMRQYLRSNGSLPERTGANAMVEKVLE
jgi:regulator of RNase E activity RraA